MCICICLFASYNIYIYIHSYADTTNCTIANKPGTGNPTRKIVCNASEHNLIHKHRNGPKCKYINHLCISDMERNQVLFGSFNQKFIGVGGWKNHTAYVFESRPKCSIPRLWRAWRYSNRCIHQRIRPYLYSMLWYIYIYNNNN